VSIFSELKRRNVFRVGIAYLATVWVLIEVADTLVSIVSAPVWIPQVLVYSAALGFPVALVLAWVYELTPKGVHVTTDSAVPETARFLGRKLDFAIIGLLVLAVGFLVVENYVIRESGDSSLAAGASIAVLPFVNVSSDPEQDYFSDGISEDLLNLLARVPDFRVISRSSSFSFRGEGIDIPSVAAQLNVSHLLEGSVRKVDDAVRITVQLIDARAETVWSEIYDRTLDDIFAVQDEITASVLEELQVTLLGAAPTADRVDPDAYALFLQAKRILDGRNNEETFALAEGFLRQALDIEPEYVRPLIELARLRHQVGARRVRLREGFVKLDAMSEPVRETRELLRQALDVDPDNAFAYGWLAWLAGGYDADVAAMAGYLERGLELDSTDPELLRGHLGTLEILGHAEEAMLLGEYAVTQDPMCVSCYQDLGRLYSRAMRFDEAQEKIQLARALEPDDEPSYDLMGEALLLKGDAQAALEEFQQMEDGPDRAKGVALALYDLDRPAAFDAAFSELLEYSLDERSREAPIFVAQVYAYTNEIELAFDWLNRVLDRDFHPRWFALAPDPLFSNLHTDPRWEEFLERLGLAPAQLEALDFKVTLPQELT